MDNGNTACYAINYGREKKGDQLPTTEAQKRAMRLYNRKTTQFVFRLRLDTDADVIDRLRKVGNRTEYVRELVRRDIREHPKS